MNAVKDLSGKKFGKLLVLKRDEAAPVGRSKWICQCDCGNTVSVYRNHLTTGNTVSCGCERIGMNSRDISGKRFGRLFVLERTENKSRNVYIYKCKCDCGKICYISGAHLRNGATKSCGCYSSEVSHNNIKLAKEKRSEFYVNDTDVLIISKETLQANNTSGCRGVSFDKSVNLWKAYINFRGKRYYLGSSTDIKDAIAYRKEAEENIFGNFLKWYSENYPEEWERIQNKKHSKDKTSPEP